ncbi:MAG: RNA-binding transcriptional accessory protein [Firmicutes bacterium]|nr:RNA-binding transcriptional accessory protein [Bacillota bacterium]
MEIYEKIASELGVRPDHAKNVIKLIDEGNTIPFIARYRKELHGSMDDSALRQLAQRLEYLRGLEERKSSVLASIEEQGKLTTELSKEIEEAETLARIEDLYRPYKPKRRTRASAAREKGLEPLAAAVMLQGGSDPAELAQPYIGTENGPADEAEALSGASDIIAETISDDAESREDLRRYIKSHGRIVSKAAADEDSVYRLYYDFSQPVSRLAGHQVLALNRGEKEGMLKVSLDADQDSAVERLSARWVRGSGACSELVRAASRDAWERLIFPSLERELRSDLTDMANEGAIKTFALNLKPLLMQAPIRGRVTMGLDPGYRNGCKVAVVDGTGRLLDTAVVYPTFSEAKREEAIKKLTALIARHGVRDIAIGNGTASRETESMAADMLKRLGGGRVGYAIVNEAGASVYSASEAGAAEFPELDVNLRSAVSIARRLQDPLAELVKIDPMAIGVGQYQHDMPQARLAAALDGVVEDCVNSVGVDANTASAALLLRVAGLGKATAANLVSYRKENGPFKSRKELSKVKGLGPKAFEQCAGFLRIHGGSELLDGTAVHPESYDAARKLLSLTGYGEEELRTGELSGLKDRMARLGSEKLAAQCGVGLPTLMDIADELIKPGRDPREELPPVVLRTDVLELSDLKPGMKLKGTVRNVVDFGAFVDIGVHQDGLVHVSQIADRFIKHPSEVLSVGDVVDVIVLEADAQKRRISLSIKQASGKGRPVKA